MSIAISMGQSERDAVYEVPDNEMAAGSTLGGPKAVCVIKASGALKTVYSPDMGASLFGTVVLRHYDRKNGMHLAQEGVGKFAIHPEHQQHRYTLAGNIRVTEDIFVLSGEPGEDGSVDPPGVYIVVELANGSPQAVEIATYAFADLRGETDLDVSCDWDEDHGALVAWNDGKPGQTRLFGASIRPYGYEATLDVAKAVSLTAPGELSRDTRAAGRPLGVLHHVHRLEPSGSARWHYLLSFGSGREEASRNYRACPAADAALDRTRTYYHSVLRRAVVLTPNETVNQGVLWAKANMLRIQLKAPTGWCFVNDPTRSVNSVGRDTAWFAYGADYICPAFSRESLMAYVRNQESDGLIVEYYNTRTNETEDYGLNINDNTPLVILALWHHFNTSGDEAFLRAAYPAAARAARRILSQRNDRGLVWCEATGTAERGIAGWRNVIKGYRLSGATTELNAECYAALKTVSRMGGALEKREESEEFLRHAEALKAAINTHLFNAGNGLYYLNIDPEGVPRTDVTADLVFPVMFGVADSKTSAQIVRRLSDDDFWTAAGIRTVSRDAHDYDPDGDSNGPYGLLGGVWVGMSFWFAFAAADYSPEFMDHALSASFRNYSMDPRRYNTVPGQFSEWLHGETLCNQGMMLSPWFPPRYLWAAIEGAGGLDLSGDTLSLAPRLASNWKWLGVRNLPYRGRNLAWLAVRIAGLRLFTNFPAASAEPAQVYADDITDHVHARGESICVMGLRREDGYLLFTGNTSLETATTAAVLDDEALAGDYRLRRFDSLIGYWQEDGIVGADSIRRGLIVQIEHQGFCLLELTQAA